MGMIVFVVSGSKAPITPGGEPKNEENFDYKACLKTSGSELYLAPSDENEILKGYRGVLNSLGPESGPITLLEAYMSEADYYSKEVRKWEEYVQDPTAHLKKYKEVPGTRTHDFLSNLELLLFNRCRALENILEGEIFNAGVDSEYYQFGQAHVAVYKKMRTKIADDHQTALLGVAGAYHRKWKQCDVRDYTQKHLMSVMKAMYHHLERRVNDHFERFWRTSKASKSGGSGVMFCD